MDAFKKTQKSKEAAKNKKSRDFQREAIAQLSNPAALREQLKEVLDAEEAGQGTAELRLKKKALQQAYDQALRKKMEHNAAPRQQHDALQQQQPNQPNQQLSTFLPPLPSLPPPPHLLPPLPPMQPPQALHQHPSLPPSSTKTRHDQFHNNHPERLPPPTRPPPPRPYEPHDDNHSGLLVQEARPVISAKPTVVTLQKAHEDKKVISMIPSSVMVKRPAMENSTQQAKISGATSSVGFGLVPRHVVAKGHKKEVEEKGDADQSYEEFMKSMKDLGAM